MIRWLYIIGIVFFTALIGYTAHGLYEQFQAGRFFDDFNHERREAIVLLAVSWLGIGALCYLEISRRRQKLSRRHVVRPSQQAPEVAPDPKMWSIYSAPKTLDAWQEREETVRTQPARKFFLIQDLWFRILRIFCGVLPIVYTYTLINYLFFWLPQGAGNIILSILFPTLLIGALMTSIGILRRKVWGIQFGYAMAIFHLLIFPLGTAGGFVMLIGLIGISGDFAEKSRRRRRVKPSTRHHRVHTPAI